MENCEVKPHKNGKFKNFLFGRKKNNHSKKRVCCNCYGNNQCKKKDQIVQVDISPDNKEEGKLPILNVNAYGNPKKIQKDGVCPGKVFPMERRGCGFHLYFCIDNGKKPNGIRSKIKTVKNEKFKFENCLEVNKRAIPCVSNTGSLAKTVKSYNGSDRSHSPGYYKNTTNSVRNSKGKETFPIDINSAAVAYLPESTVKKSREGDVSKQIDSSLRNYEENMPVKSGSILRPRKTSFQTGLAANAQEAKIQHPLTPQSLPEKPYSNLERQIYYSESETPKLVGPYLDEEAAFKEYDAMQNIYSKRATLKRGSRLSRMSLRQKRQSFVDDMVPEILSKLDNIEEKLSELEKVYEDKGKNITNIVGISCNSAKSPCTDLINLSGNGEMNKNTFDSSTSKLDSYNIRPVLIRSCGEDILVTEPENVSVIKKKGSKQGSKQLVYHNTQELDAHNITSKSFSKTKTIEGQNPMISAQPKEPAKKKDIWRKISEELKF